MESTSISFGRMSKPCRLSQTRGGLGLPSGIKLCSCSRQISFKCVLDENAKVPAVFKPGLQRQTHWGVREGSCPARRAHIAFKSCGRAANPFEGLGGHKRSFGQYIFGSSSSLKYSTVFPAWKTFLILFTEIFCESGYSQISRGSLVDNAKNLNGLVV